MHSSTQDLIYLSSERGNVRKSKQHNQSYRDPSPESWRLPIHSRLGKFICNIIVIVKIVVSNIDIVTPAIGVTATTFPAEARIITEHRTAVRAAHVFIVMVITHHIRRISQCVLREHPGGSPVPHSVDCLHKQKHLDFISTDRQSRNLRFPNSSIFICQKRLFITHRYLRGCLRTPALGLQRDTTTAHGCTILTIERHRSSVLNTPIPPVTERCILAVR